MKKIQVGKGSLNKTKNEKQRIKDNESKTD